MTNGELQDNEQNVRTVRVLPMFRTAIGDAIFPGDDIHTLQLRSDFGEMLVQHLNSGGEIDLMSIGASFPRFTPARVSTTTHPVWTQKVIEEWEQLERPRIFAAMEVFFLDGGLEGRLDKQRTFFAALQAAGLRFGNTARLLDLVMHAGDWRETFVSLLETGRDLGIRPSGTDLDRSGIAAAMHGAGFSRPDQHRVWSNLPAEPLPRVVTGRQAASN